MQANGLEHSLLHYPSSGGDLVLIPGITSTATALDFLARELCGTYNVVVPDLRGRGRSDRAPVGHYGLNDYAVDVDAIIGELGLHTPTLIGHSLGARIVARWGAGRANHGPLVLVDPPLSSKTRPYPTPWSAFATQLAEAQAGTTTEQVRRFYPLWSERELEIRTQELPTCDVDAVKETYAGFESDEFEADWRRLTAPLALIRGAESPMVSDKDAKRLIAAAPHATVAVVPGAGHMVPWDNMAGFLLALENVLPTGSREGGFQ